MNGITSREVILTPPQPQNPLPNELWPVIFQHLSLRDLYAVHIPSVCRQWEIILTNMRSKEKIMGVTSLFLREMQRSCGLHVPQITPWLKGLEEGFRNQVETRLPLVALFSEEKWKTLFVESAEVNSVAKMVCAFHEHIQQNPEIVKEFRKNQDTFTFDKMIRELQFKPKSPCWKHAFLFGYSLDPEKMITFLFPIYDLTKTKQYEQENPDHMEFLPRSELTQMIAMSTPDENLRNRFSFLLWFRTTPQRYFDMEDLHLETTLELVEKLPDVFTTCRCDFPLKYNLLAAIASEWGVGHGIYEGVSFIETRLSKPLSRRNALLHFAEKVAQKEGLDVAINLMRLKDKDFRISQRCAEELAEGREGLDREAIYLLAMSESTTAQDEMISYFMCRFIKRVFSCVFSDRTELEAQIVSGQFSLESFLDIALTILLNRQGRAWFNRSKQIYDRAIEECRESTVFDRSGRERRSLMKECPWASFLGTATVLPQTVTILDKLPSTPLKNRLIATICLCAAEEDQIQVLKQLVPRIEDLELREILKKELPLCAIS